MQKPCILCEDIQRISNYKIFAEHYKLHHPRVHPLDAFPKSVDYNIILRYKFTLSEVIKTDVFTVSGFYYL